ncbi:hypothetical protein GGU11DRAFT_825431 [Lentinula aff. detonsa]|nr:hypothetical protein GGU11DRAFT_825431 [Lentinula aff. detonsa]
MQENFGGKSLIYVWAVLEELVDTKTPCFFAHPSPWITLPSELETKITESVCGMELTWSPQEIILSHPVTGWFITHRGWNSIQEALVHRIPLIFWPCQADQPYNATLMSGNHQAGFDLFSVRTRDNGVRLPSRYKDAPAPPCFTTEEAKEEIRALFKRIKDEEGVVV